MASLASFWPIAQHCAPSDVLIGVGMRQHSGYLSISEFEAHLLCGFLQLIKAN